VRISVTGFLTTSRATLSAFSLQSIPLRPGVHIKRMFLLAISIMLLILIARVIIERKLYLRVLKVMSESIQMLNGYVDSLEKCKVFHRIDNIFCKLWSGSLYDEDRSQLMIVIATPELVLEASI